MKEIKLPIMFSQITNNIELRAFAVQIAQNFTSDDDNIDTLIDKSKVIEAYVKGDSKLPDITQDVNDRMMFLYNLMKENKNDKENNTN